MMQITPTAYTERTVSMLGNEWEERTQAIFEALTYMVAKRVYDSVRDNIPGGEFAAYKRAITLARLSGVAKGVAGAVVYAKTGRRKVRRVDASRVVLYVRLRRKLRRPVPEVVVLSKYSPWTVETLPVVPSHRDAEIISRVVREREVDRVRKDRERDKPKWRKDLFDAGVQVLYRDQQKNLLRGIDTTPDMAFEALRLEMGLDGRRAKAHWRPALREVGKLGSQFWLKQPKMLRIFFDPTYQGWKKSSSADTLSVGETQKYAAFQKALRVRF